MSIPLKIFFLFFICYNLIVLALDRVGSSGNTTDTTSIEKKKKKGKLFISFIKKQKNTVDLLSSAEKTQALCAKE